MRASPGPTDTSRFRALVARRLGLDFDDAKIDYLAEILRERLEARGGDAPTAYLERLSRGDPEEVRSLARLLTIGETYFFRYNDHFRAFTEVVLPSRAGATSRPLRILSAGCSSGEEAYTLAILVREHSPIGVAGGAEIRGIDINPASVARAKAASYTAWSLRDTPAELRERYFSAQGRDYRLVESVRSSVTFEERNLLDEDPTFWQPGAFDVVFCRNVLMYLTPECMRAVVRRIGRSLAPGGFLFLGHAETLRGVSSEHHLRHTHDTFYYQRRDPSRLEGPPVEPAAAEEGDLATMPLRAALGLDDATWVEVIQGATDRIAQLSRDPRLARSAPPPPPPRVDWDLRPAVDMLRQERFVEAMDLLQGLPAASRSDPDAQLLRAVLLTNGGKPGEAEAVCQEILARDELHAGAHYLVALCHEHRGDRRAAREHDQIATYLDAGFAMPHLHLGLVARRAGDVEQARVELRRARTLLAGEDPSRVLLYGGGFSREGLVALCDAELRACGGDA